MQPSRQPRAGIRFATVAAEKTQRSPSVASVNWNNSSPVAPLLLRKKLKCPPFACGGGQVFFKGLIMRARDRLLLRLARQCFRALYWDVDQKRALFLWRLLIRVLCDGRHLWGGGSK